MKIPGSNWANEELSGIIRYAVMLCKRPVMLCWWCSLCAMSCVTDWRDFQSPKVWTLLLVSASRDLFPGRSVFLALLEEEGIRHAEVVQNGLSSDLLPHPFLLLSICFSTFRCGFEQVLFIFRLSVWLSY